MTTTTNTTTAKPETTKPRYQKATKTAEGLALDKLLFEGLKAKGIKATKALAPAGHYFRVLVDGKPIAYVNYRGTGSLRVEPKLEGGKTPAGFAKQEKARGGLGYVATVSDEAGVALAVEALVLAAGKLAS